MKLGSKPRGLRRGRPQRSAGTGGTRNEHESAKFQADFPHILHNFFLRFSPEFSDNEKVVGCGFYEK